MDALNQSIPAPTEAALKRNKMQIEGFNSTIKDPRGAQDFDNNMGHYVHGFVHTTGNDGVLSQYLILMKQQQAMRAEQAGEPAHPQHQNKLEGITAQSQQLMNASIQEPPIGADPEYPDPGSASPSPSSSPSWWPSPGQGHPPPLKELLRVLTEVTQGDMTQRVGFKSQNEFGQLASQINLLIPPDGDVLKQLSQASTQLNSAAHDNRHTTESVRADLEKQRQETASVAAAMTQMEASVREVAQAANQTPGQVQDVEKASEMGRKVWQATSPPPISSRASCSRPAR